MNDQTHQLGPDTDTMAVEQADIDAAAAQEEALRQQAEYEHLKQRVVLLRALSNRRKEENNSLRAQLRLLEERLNSENAESDPNPA